MADLPPPAIEMLITQLREWATDARKADKRSAEAADLYLTEYSGIHAVNAQRFDAAAAALEAAALREQQLREDIDAFWFHVSRAYDIEDRAYFEQEAPKNGFRSPLAQAAHHIWKRNPKVEALEAQLAAAEAREQALRTAVEWQPIETAPKDGTWIVLWVPCDDPADGGDVITAAYATFNDVDHRDGWRNNVNGYEVEGCPTRWMPLRAPPEALG